MTRIFRLHLLFLFSPLQLASLAKVPSIQKENAGMFHSYLLSIILLFMLSLLSKADDNAPYPGCGPPTTYQCGTKPYDVGLPFWLSDRPRNCGHPEFELACDEDNSILTIKIGDKTYQIKSIDYKNRVLTVIDPDLSGEECPHDFTDPISNSSVFKYASFDVNIYFYFYFNCTLKIDSLYRIDCPPGGEIQLYSYYAFFPLSDLPELVGKCSSNAGFPINQTVHDLIKDGKMKFWEVMKMMQDGINITWTAQDSGKCFFLLPPFLVSQNYSI